jgi:hypothetical protein
MKSGRILASILILLNKSDYSVEVYQQSHSFVSGYVFAGKGRGEI